METINENWVNSEEVIYMIILSQAYDTSYEGAETIGGMEFP
nr:MAG TPA: hypothetical protein [Caudoviricetes sp.]